MELNKILLKTFKWQIKDNNCKIKLNWLFQMVIKIKIHKTLKSKNKLNNKTIICNQSINNQHRLNNHHNNLMFLQIITTRPSHSQIKHNRLHSQILE